MNVWLRNKFQFILLFYNMEANIRNIGLHNLSFFSFLDIRILSHQTTLFSIHIWDTSSSREDYPMERGNFYAVSVPFFIFVFTSTTHFSEWLSDGATIFKHVRHVNVWILMSWEITHHSTNFQIENVEDRHFHLVEKL